MKSKINLLLVAVIALTSVGFIFSSASVKAVVVAKTEKAVETQDAKGGNPNIKSEDAATAVTIVDEQVIQDKEKKDKSKDDKGKISADNHRSVVAAFVRSLLAVADREGGIGQEVRVIAQEQNDTKERAADLINAVEKRSKIKTFFIGTSYKNLGELRSQMVAARNQIEQLKRLAEKAENPQDKAELQTQIQALEQQQARIDSFITSDESKFSLFGWAVKMFR
jgi:hypothetical protein